MKSSRAVIIDYGIGNVFSVCQAVRHAGGEPILTRERATIATADRAILPGVGAFGRAAAELERFGLADVVREFARSERPLLGLCVGMQLLFDSSDEFGEHPGLGLLAGRVVRIPTASPSGEPLRVPHIGWNEISPTDGEARWATSVLADAVPGRSAFYFVHSYSAQPRDPATILATAKYGGHAIVAAVSSAAISGLQFHPERSSLAGQRVIQRFLVA